MGGLAREQRKRVQSIDSELTAVRRRLSYLYNLIETTDMEVDDFRPRLRDLRERQERLEHFAEQAREDQAQPRSLLDDVNAIAAYAREMRDFLSESELTERRAFIQSFVKEIVVMPGNAQIRYAIPMPNDKPKAGRHTENVALRCVVLLPQLNALGVDVQSGRVRPHALPNH